VHHGPLDGLLAHDRASLPFDFNPPLT
jgi:hypothetical protein